MPRIPGIGSVDPEYLEPPPFRRRRGAKKVQMSCVVTLVKEGKSPQEIADILGISRQYAGQLKKIAMFKGLL